MTTNDPSQTVGKFREGEILTLKTGDTWRVRALDVNEDGRHGVSLVNPFDPDYRTSFYADVLPGFIGERPAPPPLCTTMPPCSICGTEVELDGSSFACSVCNCSWSSKAMEESEPGEWDNDRATQCTALIQPYAQYRSGPYREVRTKIYRCVLDHDHDVKTLPIHENPEYGSEWRDDHPRSTRSVLTASQASGSDIEASHRYIARPDEDE